jgi:hypothetical protein
MQVEKAAAAILKGVPRNPERRVFPYEIRALCWLDRMAPRLTNWLFLQSLKKARGVLESSQLRLRERLADPNCYASSMAAFTRSGVIGMRFGRAPVAS